MRLVKILLFFLILAIGCTQEVQFPTELGNKEKNVTIVVGRFPEEPTASTNKWERVVQVYSKHEDFKQKENPIDSSSSSGFKDFSTITINDIVADSLYLRVTLWEIFSEEFKFTRGFYFYDNEILISDYNSNVLVNTTISGQWVKG